MATTAETDGGVLAEVLYGRDLVEPGEVQVRRISDRVAIAGSPGLNPSRKRDLNEDVIAYLRCEDREAAVVADGHFGKAAAEIAVDSMVAELKRTGLRYTDPLAAITLMFNTVQERIVDALADEFKSIDTSPETSLMITLHVGDQLHVAQLGDCYCLRRSEGGGMEPLAPLQRSWLGIGSALRTRCPERQGVRGAAREMGIGFWQRRAAEKACYMRQPISTLFSQTLPRNPEDTYVICTDGLLEGSEDGEQQINYLIMKAGQKGVDEIAHDILRGVLSRSGEDNVGLVLMLPRA